MLIAGSDTSDNNGAVLRCAINNDLTVAANWTIYKTGLPAGEADSVSYAGGSVFILSVGSDLYASSNNGQTWSLVLDVSPSSVGLVAGDPITTTGWCTGGFIGYNASPATGTYSNLGSVGLLAGAARFGNGRLLVTESTATSPEFRYSDDQGSTFSSAIAIGVNKNFDDLAWVTGDTWIAATGDNFVARTTNVTTASSWSLSASTGTQNLFGIDTDGVVCVAVGSQGVFTVSTDAGVTWTTEATAVSGKIIQFTAVRKF